MLNVKVLFTAADNLVLGGRKAIIKRLPPGQREI